MSDLLRQKATELEKQRFDATRRAYALVFSRGPEVTTAVATVLRDLANECFAFHTTFDADPRIHARREGRRDVWLHIQEMLQVPNDEAWARYRQQFEPILVRLLGQPSTAEENEF